MYVSDFKILQNIKNKKFLHVALLLRWNNSVRFEHNFLISLKG